MLKKPKRDPFCLKTLLNPKVSKNQRGPFGKLIFKSNTVPKNTKGDPLSLKSFLTRTNFLKTVANYWLELIFFQQYFRNGFYQLNTKRAVCIKLITTHNPPLLVRLKVEPFEKWNPGPSFKTYQPQRAKFAARNSVTNTVVYNFSRFQLTIRQIRGIRCTGQLEIVESAAYSGFRGSDSGIRNSASGIRSSDTGFRRLIQASNKKFVL